MTSQEQRQASRRYEQACQAIMHRHSPTLGYGWVEGSRTYRGNLSEVERQIDATIHLPDKQLIAVECKQRTKEALDVQDVESFDAKVRIDLGLDGAMMISSIGFTKAAVNYARKRDIGLFTLNWAATADEYIMKMDSQLFVGFLEELQAHDEVTFTQEALFVESLQVSDEGSFMQSTTVQKSEI